MPEIIFITAARVRAICGGISYMCLWRWSQDSALHFPVPTYIRARKYWHEAEVLTWLEGRAAASANGPRPPRPPRPGTKAAAKGAA